MFRCTLETHVLCEDAVCIETWSNNLFSSPHSVCSRVFGSNFQIFPVTKVSRPREHGTGLQSLWLGWSDVEVTALRKITASRAVLSLHGGDSLEKRDISPSKLQIFKAVTFFRIVSCCLSQISKYEMRCNLPVRNGKFVHFNLIQNVNAFCNWLCLRLWLCAIVWSFKSNHIQEVGKITINWLSNIFLRLFRHSGSHCDMIWCQTADLVPIWD